MIAPGLIRWHVATLEHAHYGVNALIPQVPRAAGDDVPPLVRVYSAFDDPYFARGRAGEEGSPDEWVLSVHSAEEMEIAAHPAARGPIGDSCIVALHLHGVAADDATATRYSSQIMRAITRCMRHAQRALNKNPIVLASEQQRATPEETMTMFTLPLDAQGDGSIAVALLIPYTLADIWTNTPIPAPPPPEEEEEP